jgi:hypothetical protein
MPESHKEALEMALTLALVCTDAGADEFVCMAEELADDMEDEIVGDIKIKAEANANAIWAERMKMHPAEKWKIWSAGGNPEMTPLTKT